MPDPLVFPDTSPRHDLPFLFAGQAQKEMFVNEAFARLDLLAQPSVLAELAAPPADPQPGQCWLVGQQASGNWSGADGCLAGWIAGAWHIVHPTPGMTVWDTATGQRLTWDGSWRRPVPPPLPAGGTTIDSEARTALAQLVQALREAGILPAA